MATERKPSKFHRVDRIAAAGLTEPRCASERGLAMGGGRRRAPLCGWQRQIRGSVPSHGARVLEVRIHLPPADSPSLAGFLLAVSKSRQLPRGTRARPGAGRQRRAGLVNITPTVGSISVGRYSSTAVPASGSRPRLHGCAKRGRVSRDQALSSVRLKQSRARSTARASQVADVKAPAACLQSDRAADGRRGWLR